MPVFPTGIDTFSNPQGTTLLATDDHANQHRLEGSAIVALENKVGLGAGSAALNQILVGNGAGTSAWGTMWNQANLGSPTITGGTQTSPLINSATMGTPSIDFIGARNAGTGVGYINSMFPAAGTLADSAGGTLTVDARANQLFFCVMGTAAGNRTIGTPSNPSPWQQLFYAFQASGSANGTLVWPAIFHGSPSALGTGTSWNYYGWRYNNVSARWDFMGQSLTLN